SQLRGSWLARRKGVPRLHLLTVDGQYQIAVLRTFEVTVENDPEVFNGLSGHALNAAARPAAVRPLFREDPIELPPDDHRAYSFGKTVTGSCQDRSRGRLNDQPFIPLGDQIEIELPHRH